MGNYIENWNTKKRSFQNLFFKFINLIFMKNSSCYYLKWNNITFFINYTGRKNLTKLQTLGPGYTFPKVFRALNPNPTSELLHRVRYSRNPNLIVQKTLFFAIFRIKLHRGLIFFLKTLPFKTHFQFLRYLFFLGAIVQWSWVLYRFLNTTLPKKFRPECRRNNALLSFYPSMFLGLLNSDPTS